MDNDQHLKKGTIDISDRRFSEEEKRHLYYNLGEGIKLNKTFPEETLNFLEKILKNIPKSQKEIRIRTSEMTFLDGSGYNALKNNDINRYINALKRKFPNLIFKRAKNYYFDSKNI
jgi:hypothetical protein